MVRRLTWLLVVSLLLPAAAARGQTLDTLALRNAIAQAGGRVIIGLWPGRLASLRQAGSTMPAAQFAAIEQRITRQYPLNIHGRAGIATALFATISDSDVARVLADSNVELMVPDHLGVPGDAVASRAGVRADITPWGVATVGAPAAWAAGLTGSGINVGIIDGGIDYTHPDLNVVGGYDFITGSNSPAAYNDNVASCGGHGTHVAGIVGARQNGVGVIGVAPAVSLYALKVFQDIGGSCLAWESDQISALDWAATNGVRVVNISIGNSSYNQIYQNAVTSAIAAGVTIVASAGNGSGGPIVYPGAYVGVIAVGALDQGNTPAYYESVGPQMWVSAPGTNILSTLPGGGTGTKSGTSMAAPHVVGVAALLLQSQPTWTPAQVQAAIRNGAVDIGAAGFDNLTGWGLVQAPTGGSGTIPVLVSLAPAARSASVVQGSAAPGDNATVTLTGTNAAATAWTAVKKKSWTTLTTASGTGNGTIAWNRNAAGLAVGTYVDTLTVTAAGITPAVLYDTLKITAAVAPVTITLTPTTRSTTAPQGGPAAGDNASVSLTGTNAWSTTWTVTRKKSWTTLTTTSGMGNGAIAWTRNTAGLAVGSYVDTLTVTATGVAPAVLFDTLRITAVPVVVTVSPTSRVASVVQGAAAPGDNATVTLSGTNAAATAWTATNRKSWLTLTTRSGTGNGTVAWTRNSSGLALGTHVDTVTVTAGSAAPAIVLDSLTITAAAVPVAVSLAPSSRSASVVQGNAAPGDNATVTLTGTNAGSTPWSATKQKSWTTLVTASGTGSGTIAWTRNTAGLAAGTYVDTLAVTAAGAAPAVLLDTLRITTAVVPLVLSISPQSRRATVLQGAAATLSDNAVVTLTGTNAATTTWTAAHRRSWTTLVTASGTGSGTLAWTRSTAGLAVGTYVDTLTVTATGVAPALLYDTLIVVPVPVTIAVSPAARSIAVPQGSVAPGDNATVTLSGTDAWATAWTVSSRGSWTALTTGSGSGTGSLTWARHTTELAVGLYIDTLTVAAPGIAPAMLYDSVRITPTTVTVAVSPGASRVSAMVGAPVAGGSATVTLTGAAAATTVWTAARRQNWTTLNVVSDTGSGQLTWTRNTTGLATGSYVDTLTITVAGATAAVLYDSVTITPPPVTAVFLPGARSTRVPQGRAAPGSSAAIVLNGANAAVAQWSVTRSQAWTTLTSSSGTGNGAIAWTRNAAGLPVGTYVDTLTIAGAGVAPGMLFDTLSIVAPSAPLPGLTTSQTGVHETLVLAAGLQSDTPRDSTAVVSDGPGVADTAQWYASTSSPRISLTVTEGVLSSSKVAWTRPVTGLAAGRYIDSIFVALVAAPEVRAAIVDTLDVIAVVLPDPDVAARELITPGLLNADQRNALDQIGNRNGQYDLGDFLAWVDRAGIHLSAALRQQLLLLPQPLPASSAPPRRAIAPAGPTQR